MEKNQLPLVAEHCVQIRKDPNWDNGRRALFNFKAQMTGTNLATGLVVVKIGVSYFCKLRNPFHCRLPRTECQVINTNSRHSSKGDFF